MIAKISSSNSANCYRLVDVGDDFRIISETIDTIRKNYCGAIENIETNLKKDKKHNAEQIEEILDRIYQRIFCFDVCCAFIFNKRGIDFYGKLNCVQTEDDLVKLIDDKAFNQSMITNNFVCHSDYIDYRFETDASRLTAIEYVDKNGKTITEIFIKKDIYIINDKGKTIETYRNNSLR